MKTERFERAMSALVKAYLNDTLQAGNCSACAVGNIISASIGGKIKIDADGDAYCTKGNISWSNVFSTPFGSEQIINMSRYKGWARKQIDATGYTVFELAKVESAFESSSTVKTREWGEVWIVATRNYTPAEIDADQYRGLVAVVNVLCDIEGIEDPAEYIALFDKGAVLS